MNRKQLKILFAMVFLMVPLMMFAQQKASISGIVKDADRNVPLSNANVVLKSTNYGSATDIRGYFKIDNINPGTYDLVISYIGYQKVERTFTVKAGQNLEVNFVMFMGEYELDPVIIKDFAQKNVPYVRSEVNKIEIEVAATRDIGEFLRNIPNVSAIRKGATQLDPVVRGFKFDQLNIRIDNGMRIEGGCPNRMDPSLSHIEIDDIEKIEIIKGPYLLRYGPSMGGFVNLITTKPEPFETKKFEIKARAIKGFETNWNGTKDRLNLKGGNDRIYFNISANSQDYGSYRDGNGTMINSSFRKRSLTTELGFIPYKNHELQLSLVQSFGRDVVFPALPMDERRDDTRLYSMNYKILNPDKKLSMIGLRGYFSDVYHEMDTKQRPTADSMIGVSKIDATVLGLHLYGEYRLNEKSKLFSILTREHTTKDGKRYKTMYMQPPMIDPKTKEFVIPSKIEYLVDGTIDNYGWAIDYSRKSTVNEIIAAFRFDINSARSEPIKLTSTTDTTFTEVNTDYTNISASFGYNRDISEKIIAGIAIGRGVRSPNMLERYVNLLPVGYDKFDYLGNPQIKPEKNHQIDLTLKFTGEKLGRITLNGFGSYVIDYISAKKVGFVLPNTQGVKGVKQYYNADPVIFRGFELTYASPSENKLGGSVIASYTRATMTMADSFGYEIKNDPLGEVPPFEARINAYYKCFNKKFIPRLTYRVVAKQEYISHSFGEDVTPGFQILDLGFTYRYNKILTLAGGINNVLDEAYYEHLSRRIVNSSLDLMEPGRVFFINMIVNL